MDKRQKRSCHGVKKIYTSINLSEAEKELADFNQKWAGKYTSIIKLWQKQTMPIHNWKLAMNQFQIQYRTPFTDD